MVAITIVRWQLNPSVVTAEDQEELVLLHMETGKFFGLDRVGSEIWTMLAQPCEAERIVAELHAVYEVTPGTLLRDVHQLLAELESNRLVRRV